MDKPVMDQSVTPVVVIASEVADSATDYLEGHLDVEIRYVDGTDQQAVQEAVAEANALIIRSSPQVDDALLTRAPHLQVIGRAGVGVDNIDVAAATARGIPVVNTPLANSHSAAEHTLGMLLAVARNIPVADHTLRDGKWCRGELTGVELYQKTAGIIGFGNIGRLVAERLQAFGVKVIANDPYIDPDIARRAGVELVTKDDLIRRSDIVTLHVPKNEETTGMIDARRIGIAKPGQILLNVARGGLLDDDALAASIRSGRHLGAGIDVWDNEPDVSSPLLELQQVVATPHLGAATREAQQRVGTEVAGYVAAILQGEKVPAALNASELAD